MGINSMGIEILQCSMELPKFYGSCTLWNFDELINKKLFWSDLGMKKFEFGWEKVMINVIWHADDGELKL